MYCRVSKQSQFKMIAKTKNKKSRKTCWMKKPFGSYSDAGCRRNLHIYRASVKETISNSSHPTPSGLFRAVCAVWMFPSRSSVNVYEYGQCTSFKTWNSGPRFMMVYMWWTSSGRVSVPSISKSPAWNANWTLERHRPMERLTTYIRRIFYRYRSPP